MTEEEEVGDRVYKDEAKADEGSTFQVRSRDKDKAKKSSSV